MYLRELTMKILPTPRGSTMHPERLIMEINLVQNYISDNFHFDHKVVQSNLNFWASLVVPGHKGGSLFRVAQGLAGDINRICVLHTYMRM